MTIILLTLMMLFAAALSPRLSRTRQWANPILFFYMPQSLLLAAYVIAENYGVISFKLKNSTLTLLIFGYAAFMIGVLVMAPLARRKLKNTQINQNDLQVASKMVTISLLFLSLSILDKYLLILSTYGNPLSNIIAIRIDYVSGKLDYGVFNSIAFFASALLTLNVGFLLALGNKAIKKKTLLFGLLLLVANDISIGGANWTFSNLCLLFCTWFAAKERMGKLDISLFKLFRFALVVGATLFLILQLLHTRSQGAIGGQTGFVDTILFYAGGNIATFGYFVDAIYPSVPSGRFTFGGLYAIADSLTSLFGVSFLPPVDQRLFIADIGFPSNTSIHFSNFYSDFGSAGLVFMSMLMGALVMYTMIKYRQKLSLLRIQYYGLMLFITLMSIRGVPTEGKYFWILLVLLPFASHITNILDRGGYSSYSTNPSPPGRVSSK